MGYKRASKKQLAYIQILCDDLKIPNPTIVEIYSLNRATKLIDQLKRKQVKKQREAKQIRLDQMKLL